MNKGIGVSPGVVVGAAYRVESVLGSGEPQTLDGAAQVAAEIARFDRAVEETTAELEVFIERIALELGAPIIRVWAGTTGSAVADDDARWRVVADLRRVAEQAAKVGVRVATEFHGGTLTDTNASTNRLLVEVDQPNLFTYWQPLLDQSDDEGVAGLRLLAPRLTHLHVYQWRTVKERRPLAEGAERWRKFLAAAAAIPGDRYAMLEFVAGDAPENFLRDAATLRAWLTA